MGYSSLLWGIVAGASTFLIIYGLQNGLAVPTSIAAGVMLTTTILGRLIERTWEGPKAHAEERKAKAEEMRAKAEEMKAKAEWERVRVESEKVRYTLLVELVKLLPEDRRSSIAERIVDRLLSEIVGKPEAGTA